MNSLDIFEMAGKELPTEISFEVGDNVLTMRRYDPYGFYRFSFKRGQLPKMLEGDWSGESKAIAAYNAYVAQKKKEA